MSDSDKPKDPLERTDSLERLVGDYRDGRVTRRTFVKRGLALGLALPTIGAILAACGEEEAAPPPPAEPAPPGEEPAPAAEEPVVGGELREGYDLDFSRMDPINTTWYDPGFFALYDAIITSDPDGNFVPQLAESWEFSPDGLTLTFKLREGVIFHSGRPLTAPAIKEVYDAIADPESGSPLRTIQEPVASYEAPDDTTLVVNLKHPYFGILNVLRTGYWRIVNVETRNRLGEDYGKQEIDGSGPFTFREWVPGSHVVVERWDEYPGSIVPYFQNTGTAYLDSIRWVAILEAAQRAIQLEQGEIDTLRGPSFTDIERLQGNADLNVTQLKEWSGYIFGVNWERTDLGWDDVRVRQAYSHALDRQAIVDTIFLGFGEPMFGPINSADAGYNPAVEQLNQFDLDAARSLMDEAGWVEGGTASARRTAFGRSSR